MKTISIKSLLDYTRTQALKKSPYGNCVAAPPAIHGTTYRTIREARAAIRRELRGHTHGKWSGLDGDVEAWHESDREGCGGYGLGIKV